MGHVPGVTLTKWRRIWSQRLPQAPLDVIEVPVASQRTALDAAVVDLCFVRLPVGTEGLHVIRLYDEVPVVMVRKDHPIAAFDAIMLADLDDEHVCDDAESAVAVDLVAGGAGVLCVPQSIARSYSRRDLVYRPIADAPSTTIALAWRVDNPHELIEEFIGIVRGRTANSARTAQARAAKPSDPSTRPRPRAHQSPKKDATRGAGDPRRARRRRRGR